MNEAPSKFNILISVIVLIFIAGMIVFVAILSVSSLTSSSIASERSTNQTVLNEVNYMNGTIGYFDVDAATLKNPTCSFTVLWNTSGHETINANNYSVSNCRVTVTHEMYNNSNWSANYSYYYDIYFAEINATASDINSAMTDATSFFPIFIVIAAVVVLIILIALIIMSLRSGNLLP